VVFAIILLAALVHALWNALVKSAADKLLTTCVLTTCAMAQAAVVLPFLPAPASASWPYLAASTGLQVTYFLLLARAYTRSDMSEAYPLMRGAAPLLVALASLAGAGERPDLAGWLGIAVLCGGILGMTGGAPGRAIVPALINAVVIAGYTLVDAAGVRQSGSPAAYTLWIYVLSGPPLALWALHVRGRSALRHLFRHWPLGVAGATATQLSYGLALWAMTLAPVAFVAALRESSILFGVALSSLLLKEQVPPRRIGAACLIVVGAIVLRLA
jgi:drug/metabolite transporter (DMT)-like permease